MKGLKQADRLRIENERILDQVDRLEHAIVEYQSLGETPLVEAIEYLDNMDSSFAERISRLLRQVTDTNPDFLESIEAVRNAADQIVKNLHELDVKTAGSMGEN